MFHSSSVHSSSNKNLPADQTLHNISIAVYVLQMISIFSVGFLSFIPLLICYLARFKSQGHWIDNHFRWQIQTFWFSSLFFFIGLLLGWIPIIGWIIAPICFLIGAAVIVVRSVRGWKKLNIQKAPQTFLD